MSDKDLAKQAFQELEKEQQEQQVKDLKLIVKRTLEKLEKKKEVKENLDKEIKILKSDLNDLKEGRLDKIKERQDVDKKAKEVSVIIIKEHIIEKELPVWRQPYTWYWNNNLNLVDNGITYNNFVGYSTSTANLDCKATTTSNIHFLSCNVAKQNTGGTYKLDNKVIKYL